jgi:hypothetical protein
MDQIRPDVRVALLAFFALMLLMAVAGWIGYDNWWVERYY